MKISFNQTVSIIRVLAMLVITFGHVIAWMGINDFQLTAIGVEIFFFISGYLYGNKEIKDKYDWLRQRVKRVMLPFWILAFVLSVYLVIESDLMLGVVQFTEALLNLQGLSHISTLPVSIGTQHMSGLSHCWFLTPMFFCYILVALIKQTRLEQIVDMHPWISLLSAVVAQIICAYVGLQLSYYLQFFVGYFYVRAENRIKRYGITSWLMICIIAIIFCDLRAIAHVTIDGTMLYDYVISRLSFNVLAVWIYMTLDIFCRRFTAKTTKLALSPAWKKLDQISFYIFLTHYMFVVEPFAVENYIEGVPLQLICMLGLIGISAWTLMKITESAIEKLSGKVN